MSIKWNGIFETEDISKKSDEELAIIGMLSWAHCYNTTPPESFGRVMLMIGQKTGLFLEKDYRKYLWEAHND